MIFKFVGRGRIYHANGMITIPSLEIEGETREEAYEKYKKITESWGRKYDADGNVIEWERNPKPEGWDVWKEAYLKRMREQHGDDIGDVVGDWIENPNEKL